MTVVVNFHPSYPLWFSFFDCMEKGFRSKKLTYWDFLMQEKLEAAVNEMNVTGKSRKSCNLMWVPSRTRGHSYHSQARNWHGRFSPWWMGRRFQIYCCSLSLSLLYVIYIACHLQTSRGSLLLAVSFLYLNFENCLASSERRMRTAYIGSSIPSIQI